MKKKIKILKTKYIFHQVKKKYIKFGARDKINIPKKKKKSEFFNIPLK